MELNFCTIASGSSGNSAFVSMGKTRILIDAGLSGKAIETGLAAAGVNPATLTAIFLTHEHSDHIRGAGILSRRFGLPVYMTAGTSAGADLGKLCPSKKFLVRPRVAVALGDLKVTPFAVPHDAGEPVGYTISTKKHKVVIATDLGHATAGVAAQLAGADIVMLEANHDVQMLQSGPYPQHLKARISGPLGHLSNAACGMLLAQSLCPKTKHIILAHLSDENNRPTMALETVGNILLANKMTASLSVAPRYTPSSMFTLE